MFLLLSYCSRESVLYKVMFNYCFRLSFSSFVSAKYFLLIANSIINSFISSISFLNDLFISFDYCLSSPGKPVIVLIFRSSCTVLAVPLASIIANFFPLSQINSNFLPLHSSTAIYVMNWAVLTKIIKNYLLKNLWTLQ